jgi:hypothetical protein
MVATLFCSERAERYNCKLVVNGGRTGEWRDISSIVFEEGIDIVDVDSMTKTVIAVADRIACEKEGDVLKCSEVRKARPKSEKQYPEWVERFR